MLSFHKFTTRWSQRTKCRIEAGLSGPGGVGFGWEAGEVTGGHPGPWPADMAEVTSTQVPGHGHPDKRVEMQAGAQTEGTLGWEQRDPGSSVTPVTRSLSHRPAFCGRRSLPVRVKSVPLCLCSPCTWLTLPSSLSSPSASLRSSLPSKCPLLRLPPHQKASLTAESRHRLPQLSPVQ